MCNELKLKIMKTYIDVKLQIVQMNNDIVTASEQIGVGGNMSTGQGDAPGRRSIWD